VLNLDKHLFRHYYDNNTFEDNGRMIVKIIYNKADPTTYSGINSLKNELNVFNLKDYNSNVAQMLDEIKLKRNEIYN